MKTFLVASILAMASIAAPQVAIAQTDRTTASIVVSGEFQKDWDKGSRLEAEGLRDMQSARRDLVKFSANVVNAQDLRDTSQSRSDNARETLESLTANPFFNDGTDARKWAKRVENAASDWEKYEERREKGAKDLRKAQKRQNDAQKAVDNAQAKINKGRALKSEAERASQREARL
ncbi:MAG: hypothetical protein AAGJ50_10310 [Pseudomonadota bacterium]